MSKGRLPGSILLVWCALVLSGVGVFAQSAGPQPLPMPAQIVAPEDRPYPGTIRLSVDATDIERHIVSVREVIPVRGGEPIVLLYPRWLPGNHSPTGRRAPGMDP
jgi:Peptidase M61 N-terminal domain